jgi:hypothetical protein
MQDVLGNMEEMALDFGFAGGDGGFEILAIEPAEVPDAPTDESRSAAIRSPYAAEIAPLLPKARSKVA